MTYEEASARTVALIDEQLVGGGADRRLIGELLRNFRARLVADAENAATLAGQEILLTTNLLVRRMGMGVDLLAPDAVLLAEGPPFEGSTLHDALRSVESELLPGTSFTIGSGGSAHVELLVGSSRSIGAAPLELRVGAEGFRAEVARASSALHVLPNARLAALAASGIAAAQIFRAFVATLVEQGVLATTKDLSFDTPSVLDLEPIVGFALGAIDLGRIDFVSAGAITNAAIYTLLRFDEISIDARAIEAKELDPPDLNRYMVSLRRDLGEPKVEILQSLSTPEATIRGVEARFDASTRAALVPLAPRVAVGVDHVESRWLVQAERPERLVVGATEGFEAFVSWHLPETPCAGCMHPTAPPDQETRTVPTISFVSFLAGFVQALVLAAADGELPAQTIHILPFSWAGSLMRPMPLAPNPGCPVRCAASSEIRSGSLV